MRCKACNKPMDPLQLFRHVEGVEELVIEDLCGECLFIARAMTYDGGPDNEIETILQTTGVSCGLFMDSEK